AAARRTRPRSAGAPGAAVPHPSGRVGGRGGVAGRAPCARGCDQDRGPPGALACHGHPDGVTAAASAALLGRLGRPAALLAVAPFGSPSACGPEYCNRVARWGCSRPSESWEAFPACFCGIAFFPARRPEPLVLAACCCPPPPPVPFAVAVAAAEAVVTVTPS